MDLMDELYGDLDDKPFGTLHLIEDSVDIYSGLENSPKIDGNRFKVNPLLSPHTMESMDIYEDIFREEQEEKDATYNELKNKFDGAQKQVKELFSQLQLLQTKNSSLNSENILLKKNICSLIKTARMEIVRKDGEISRLSNRSGQGIYGQHVCRSQMEIGPTNTRPSLNNSTCSVLISQGTRKDNVLNEVNQHKGRNQLSDYCTYPPTTSTKTPQPFEVLQRCPRTDLDNPLQCQNKSAAKSNSKTIHCSQTLTVQPEQEYIPVHPNRTLEIVKNPTTFTVAGVSNVLKTNDSALRVPDITTDCSLKDNKNSPSELEDKLEKPQKCTSRDKQCNSNDANESQKSQRRENSKSGRTEKDLIKDSSVSNENRNQQPEVPVNLKSSEQLKSPSSRSHKASPSVSSQKSSKSLVKTAAEVETQSQRQLNNQNADRISRETKPSGLSTTTCTVVDEASHSQSHKGKKRDSSGHERNKEKSFSAERRSSRTERSRNHEQKRQKESDRSKRNEGNNSSSSNKERSNRSDSSKEYERRSVREKDNKDEDKRSKKQVDACGQAFSSAICDFQHKDVYKEKSSKSKGSHIYDNKTRKMEDFKCPDKNGNSDENCFGAKGIDKDRKRKKGGHLEHRVHKHKASKNYLTKDNRNSSPKGHNVVGKGQDSKSEQDRHLETASPSMVAVGSDPCKTTEDNSPNRKLSFMETLNLTLSPLKKQKQSSDPREAIGVTSKDASPEYSNLSDPGEEFFVIDEVSSSDKAQSIPKINSSRISDSSVNMEVSSTISADIVEPSKIICDFEEVDTSTTVGEETMSSSQPGFPEPDSTEKEEQSTKSSNPVLFCPDEDSMMLILKNIKVIPEPLSPLTSPVRQVKKLQPHSAEKQPHVKSLKKDLSSVTTGCNEDDVNMDMNKENKSPDTSVTAPSYKGTKYALSASGTEKDELEDGEIVSESEEEGPLFIQTPLRVKDKSTLRTDPSPKLSAVGKRVSPKKSCIPAKYSERSKSSKSSASNVSPSLSKRRFKTVSPPLKAAVYTIDGFMNMLRSIRVELRKKYMKLQKNVTKTAFCCIVDMSQASFIEFINAVDLEKMCCQGNGIKVRLNKIISFIMSKVTKNGIVNRIFEQRAGDLKQKLWTFVDGQFEFLFKELNTTLKSGSETSKNGSFENKNATLKRKETESEVVEKKTFNTPGHLHRAKMSKVDTGSYVRAAPPNNLPCRGLGSRGKNIKAVMNEDDQPAKVATSHQPPTSSSERSVHEGTTGSETRISSNVQHLSHNGSTQDFEILTEQQTTSLTFNLVSDSQMGEIFKCLLQGSDFLESSVPIGNNTSCPLSTPRKEGLRGESLIGIMTPNKTTPSKFITSWPSISPYKFASNNKMLVDPAILDESCLLEVPSNSEPCRLSLQSTVIPQKSYSILAEDLAVSLTIPSPLKSDSHLSFLHPGTGQPPSSSNSVLSAHYSEDAVLDGEDAAEQDIHLSLDTDNSSCGSSPSRTWEASDSPGFQFQPNLPMQAVVMERSNDHFIVRIRRTSSGPFKSNRNEGKAGPVSAECQEPFLKPYLTLTHEDLGSTPGETSNKIPAIVDKSSNISDKAIEAQQSSQKSSSEGVCDEQTSLNNDEHVSKEACITAHEKSSATESETSEVVSGKVKSAIQSSHAPESETERVSRKSKEHRSAPKAKHQKVKKSQDKHSKSRHKKRSKSSTEKHSKIAVPQVSPSNLSAKNVIRKKGEVVVTWTRDEDRDILIELKMRGTSPKTFGALSKRLKKSTEQIEERFSQLMKLFKKKGKMEN